MSATEALYAAYLRLRAQLVDHARGWLAEEMCEGLAGEAMASLVDLAMEGRPTVNGPWAWAFTQLTERVNLFLSDRWHQGPMLYAEDMPDPPEGFGEELCMLYGAIFDAAYEARLSTADRTMIKAIVACGSPPNYAECTLMELLTLQRRDLEPLRCAFFAIEEHESGTNLVCKLSGRLAQLELQRHLRWSALRSPREVSGAWLG